MKLIRNQKFNKFALPLLGIGLVGIVSLVLYFRFPNNISAPNFYAEDGSVFYQNIQSEGILKSIANPFNGYFISGLYILEAFAIFINSIIGNGIVTLPLWFGIVSILFMSTVVTLPFFLFRKTLGIKKSTAIVLLGSLLPLPNSPHVVIGNIGNLKWIFLYLAFLLICYVLLSFKHISRPKLLLIYSVLLLSAYTNSTIYALMPALSIPYITEYLQKKKSLITFVKKKSTEFFFKSTFVLYILLLPQIIFVLLNGIPKLAGYLDAPFRSDRAIELFINRTFLFGGTHLFNSYLNDVIVVILFILFVFIGLRYLKNTERIVFVFSLYTAGVASLLFTLNRTGVTDHFLGYDRSGSGPDQFFYAQTLVMYLPIVMVTASIGKRLFSKKAVGHAFMGLMVLAMGLSGVVSNLTFGESWRNASVFENDAGRFTDNLLLACAQQTDQSQITVTVYPYATGQFAVTVPKEEACKNLDNYQDSIVDVNLRPFNNNHSPILSNNQFTQTFISTQNGLNGISLFVSTFGKPIRKGDYKLRILDENCQLTIRESVIPKILQDNSFVNLQFETIDKSKDIIYCFDIVTPEGSFDPIAIQKSNIDIYNEGYLIEENLQANDVVFKLLYTTKKSN